MKTTPFLILALLITASGFQTANGSDGEPAFRFSGFVKHDFFYDSRAMVAARQGQFSLFPAGEQLNEAGNDRNAQPQFHMLAIQSRLIMETATTEAFGGEARGFVEGAFFGNIESDINGFRLRHAFVEINWDDTHKLMFGQFWHPMFAVQAVPGVVAFNTGAPFKPFARNPQIRYTYTTRGTSVILAALSQIDFASQGGTLPLRRSGVPNLHAQIRQQAGGFSAGVGFDYKALRPDLLSGEEILHSYAATAYGTYTSGSTRVMTQITYGQNLFDHLMLGGFAVNQPDPSDESRYNLVNLETGSAWMDISTGSSVRAGLFAGYTANFGAGEAFTGGGPAYRGSDIDHIWRISPRAEWNSGPVRLSLEAEISSAAYGTPDEKGVVRNTEDIKNYRLLFASWYFF